MTEFDLTKDNRKDLFNFIYELLEDYYKNTRKLNVSSNPDSKFIKSLVKDIDFDKPGSPNETIHKIINNLKNYTVHNPHPAYYGLFNPRTNFISILADVITAYINPQLAAWSQAPYANEVEQFIIQEFGKKFGYQNDSIDGTFCSGGGQSNLTSIICALNHHFPKIKKQGLFEISKRPIIYCSSEFHHSILKAARVLGLGSASIHSIPVNENMEINCNALSSRIKSDINNGSKPFMVIGTAGTTGVGAIDDLEAISEICQKHNLWFHVDAAYGGAIIITKYKNLLKGIEKSNSITLDFHKWFSVPMATSLFLTNNKSILDNIFNTSPEYMPNNTKKDITINPYLHSLQWSRGFTGLKIYLPLAVYGWETYKKVIENQVTMGESLKRLLQKHGWIIKNNSPLPVVCFTHPDFIGNNKIISLITNNITESGEAWLSTYPVNGNLTLRACITNYATNSKDLNNLVSVLNKNKEIILKK